MVCVATGLAVWSPPDAATATPGSAASSARRRGAARRGARGGRPARPGGRRMGPWWARRLGVHPRLPGEGEQPDGERVEVDLLAQAGGECVHGAGGVVAGAAEAPV